MYLTLFQPTLKAENWHFPLLSTKITKQHKATTTWHVWTTCTSPFHQHVHCTALSCWKPTQKMIMKNDNRLEQSLPGAARSVVCHSRNKPYRVREARADLPIFPPVSGTRGLAALSCITMCPRHFPSIFLADLKEITLNISDRREVFDKKVVVYLNFSGHLSQ